MAPTVPDLLHATNDKPSRSDPKTATTATAARDPRQPRWYNTHTHRNFGTLSDPLESPRSTRNDQFLNYQLSTVDSGLGRRPRVFYSNEEDLFTGLRKATLGTEYIRTAAAGPEASLGSSAHPSPSKACTPRTEHHGEEETFQAVWEGLIALVECFQVEPTTKTVLTDQAECSAGVRQQAGGEATSSSHSAGSNRAQGDNTGQQERNSNSGQQSPNQDQNNNSPSDRQGGNRGEDFQSPEGVGSSSNDPFACPFHKHDPVRYATCHDKRFTDIDSVLRHHVRKTHYDKGHVTLDMSERLNSIRRQNRESKWKAIYKALFEIDAVHVSPYWTRTMQCYDIEDNISVMIETVELTMQPGQPWAQYVEWFNSLADQNFKRECEQAQRRQEIMKTEGIQRLQQRFQQEFSIATGYNNSVSSPEHGIFDTYIGPMLASEDGYQEAGNPNLGYFPVNVAYATAFSNWSYIGSPDVSVAGPTQRTYQDTQEATRVGQNSMPRSRDPMSPRTYSYDSGYSTSSWASCQEENHLHQEFPSE